MNSNSQWKWKGTNKENIAQFDNMMHDDETFCKKSAGLTNAKHSSRQCKPNILTNHNALDSSRNASRQNYRSTHHSSSMLQSTSMIPPRMQHHADVENSYHRNSSIFTVTDGVIHISLRHGVRIDITVDNSIRLTSCSGQIVISLSNTGDAAAVKHMNGLVQQTENLIQIVTNDRSQSDKHKRYVIMGTNGITFANGMMGESEAFTLDSIGTRQSRKEFVKLTPDETSAVFFRKCKHGSEWNDEAAQLIRKASVKNCADDGMDVITINDFRFWQMKDGLVTVARMSFPFKIRASPMNCSFTLSTTHIHCTASSKQSSHIFVRCQDQSMHYDGQNFVVRYKGNSAGFDKNDFLFVY